MNTPSAETIQAVTEVLQLASLLDHRIPQPDKGRVLAWSNQVERHQLGREDMLDATQSFYDRHSDQPISVGAVIDGARRIKRDRLDREDEADRERRQDANGSKAAEAIATIADAWPAVPAPTSATTDAKTARLDAARERLQTCHGRAECREAIREYSEALKAKQGRKQRLSTNHPDPA